MGITFTSFQLPGASLVSQDRWQMRESVKWTLLPVLSLPLGGSNLNKLQYAAKQQKTLGFYIEEKGKESINVAKAVSPATWEAVGGRHQGTDEGLPWTSPEQSQVKGISIRQPQDVHGHDTSARGSGGLWSGLACSRTITTGVGTAIAPPRYSQELLFAFCGTQNRCLSPWVRGPAGMKNQGLTYVCITRKQEFSSEQERSVYRYLLAPFGSCYSRLNLVISIQVPCLSCGKGLTAQLCVWGLSNPTSSCTAGTIILSSA